MKLVFIFQILFVLCAGAADEWNQFRGSRGDGVSDSAGVPDRWSENKNIKWKTALPGSGHSSPVILSNQAWLTTASENGSSLRVIGLDREKGIILHDVEVFQQPARGDITAKENSYASPTPVIEAGRLYVSFGTYGNACIDTTSGKVVWRNNQLRLVHDNNGPGSSPIIYKNLFLLHCDGVDIRYIAALDKTTGSLVWGVRRSNFVAEGGAANKSFSTPIVINWEGKDQLISVYAKRVSAYDPVTGRELWAFDYPGHTIVPRPVFADGLLYISGGLPKAELWAIRPGTSGLIGDDHLVWKTIKQVPAVSSVLLYGQRLFMVSDNGIASCLEAKSGKLLWSERLGGNYFASPVAAEGNIYFCADNGKTTVVKTADQFGIVATNTLDGGLVASPAFAGKALYLRSKTHLYRIEK